MIASRFVSNVLDGLYGTGRVRERDITVQLDGRFLILKVNSETVRLNTEQALDLVDSLQTGVDQVVDSQMRIQKAIKVFKTPDSNN